MTASIRRAWSVAVGAIDIAVVDQQLGRGSCPGCGLDRILQRIAHHVELAAVHSDNLGPDGEARVERGAIPQHASDLAVHADGEPARVSEIAVLAVLLRTLDPLR